MKKIFLILVVVFSFIACNREGGSKRHKEVENFLTNEKQIRVLATTEMIADLVRQLGKEKVCVISLIAKNLDPHSYQLVKGDDELLSASHLIFSNGLGLEHGASLNAFLHRSEKNHFLGNFIEEERLLYFDGVVDPHIWMDISLWAELVDPIVEKLSAFSPGDREYFIENGNTLKEKLITEHEKTFALLQKIPEEKRYLVTSHDAFNYFARSYLANPKDKNWKKRFMAPEGLSPDSQLSIVDIQQIVDHLQEYKIKVLFTESGINEDSIRKVLHAVESSGFSVRLCEKELYADSMIDTDQEIPYLEMIRYNAHTLYENLGEDE